MYKYLFEYLFLIPFGIYLGVEFLGHMVILCIIFFLEISKLLSIEATSSYIPTSNVQMAPGSPNLQEH